MRERGGTGGEEESEFIRWDRKQLICGGCEHIEKDHYHRRFRKETQSENQHCVDNNTCHSTHLAHGHCATHFVFLGL